MAGDYIALFLSKQDITDITATTKNPASGRVSNIISNIDNDVAQLW